MTGDSSTQKIISFRQNEKVPFSVAVTNWELIQVSFPNHTRIREQQNWNTTRAQKEGKFS